ncbi:MAG: helix-turn-helix domain-containing protein [Planctomycetaceae bacterium]
MRVRFRLKQLLARQGKSDHGIITQIENSTGIERHKVSRLINGKEDKLSLEHLGQLCRFLIQDCHVDPRELPGALFELEPSKFLALLQNTPTLHACFGVRLRKEAKPFPWAAGADSVLHGKMLELLLRSEAQSRDIRLQRGDVTPSLSSGDDGLQLHSQIRQYRQEMVHAVSLLALEDPSQRENELELLRNDAERVDAILHSPGGGPVEPRHRRPVRQVALILGSVKSNPVCELSTARGFNAVAWGTHGRSRSRQASGDESNRPLVASPQERAVPFFIRYRDGQNSQYRDPQVPSCYAGTQLCTEKVKCGHNSADAGIYFETDSGKWDWIPCSETTDAAIIYWDHDKQLGNVEVVMGGFSSLATLLLGMNVEHIVDHLFPASYETEDRAVGAFVVQFDLTGMKPDVQNQTLPQTRSAPTVIRLAPAVLQRRLERMRS